MLWSIIPPLATFSSVCRTSITFLFCDKRWVFLLIYTFTPRESSPTQSSFQSSPKLLCKTGSLPAGWLPPCHVAEDFELGIVCLPPWSAGITGVHHHIEDCLLLCLLECTAGVGTQSFMNGKYPHTHIHILEKTSSLILVIDS